MSNNYLNDLIGYGNEDSTAALSICDFVLIWTDKNLVF